MNIFVKQEDGLTDFEAECWPGNSVWIDYFNQNAAEFYSGLYSFDNFKGSTHRYYPWNDMNEPSIFNTVSRTMPTTAKHIKADGYLFEHREVHNAYGAAHQKSS